MTFSFTNVYVRNRFMQMELLGFVSATIRLPIVRKVIEYGIDKRCLRFLEIYLHNEIEEKMSITFFIDWDLNGSFNVRNVSSNINESILPKEGEMWSLKLAEVARLFGEFKTAKKLTYWYNCGWVSNSAGHDAACGISRGGTAYQPIRQGLVEVSSKHELLEELGYTLRISPDD